MNSFSHRVEFDDTSDGATLTQRIQALLPNFRDRAQSVEQRRSVPSEHIAALREAGFFDIVKPAEFGGKPKAFSELVDATIEVAAACPSTGWVAGLLSAHQWLLAMFPGEAQEDVWGHDADALLCGSYAPTTMAEKVPGGYKLSGRWAFASGCDNAQWSLCAALLPDPNGAKPVPAFLLVPAKDYVIEDTWHVIGLAGTGSKTLVLNDVFVPEHRKLTFPQATSGKTPGSQLYDRGLFKMPLLTGIAFCLAGTGVGAAKGALQAYIDLAKGRVTRGAVAGGNSRMAEFATVQLRVAEAAASVDAAREILIRDVSRAEHIAQTQPEVSIEDRLQCRRSQAFAVTLALRAVEALNASTGGHGLDLGHPVQRYWRDTNAVARHISMNWDAVGTMVGQHMLGLEPLGQY